MSQKQNEFKPVWQIATRQMAEISDSEGNSISLPKYGSLTPNELHFLKAIEASAPDSSDDLGQIAALRDLVAGFIKIRFRMDEDTPNDEIVGGDTPIALLLAIQAFIFEEAAMGQKGKPGKLPPTAGSLPTGTRFTGDSSSTIPMSPDSTVQTLDTAQLSKSSKPSKSTKAKASDSQSSPPDPSPTLATAS